MNMAVFSKEAVAEWVSERMDVPCSFLDYQVVYDTHEGELCAAVVYENYFDQRDIHMHLAGKGNWMTREFFEHAFRYPFEQLGCVRVTGLVTDPQKLKFYQLLGFKIEGCLRQALEKGDLYIVGMLKDECKFYGKANTKSAAAA